jgi:hypothetical protein
VSALAHPAVTKKALLAVKEARKTDAQKKIKKRLAREVVL